MLSADPYIESVRYWDGRAEADVIVAYSDDEAAQHAPRFVVTSDDEIEGAGMCRCNPNGLAMALAGMSGGTLDHVSWAKPGTPRGTEPVQFPAPVGLRYGSSTNDKLTVTPAGSSISSIVVDITTDDGPTKYAVVDDAAFLAAACWAAGVISAGPFMHSAESITPVEVAAAYIKACQDAGLVIARQEPF